MRFVLLILILLVVAGLGYIRLAPSDAARWHVPVEETESADFDGGAVRVVEASPEDFAAAAAFMEALPRTQVLAGSTDAGRVTYITRSAAFGFPDYTTLEYADGTLKAHARLRFGRSDMGVNRERLEGLLAALQG
ncbi:DUF1499 domain-containing protein [Roseobacter weihaiensis]|uniref:DUF1499 domain-containing protein n=1 Tax=Roseobacter weihaiensis TaxID=2763262 RepID=UPI001D0B8BF2|nr:DUF1499 domain-containing protein [Roseobacter sp. H9]